MAGGRIKAANTGPRAQRSRSACRCTTPLHQQISSCHATFSSCHATFSLYVRVSNWFQFPGVFCHADVVNSGHAAKTDQFVRHNGFADVSVYWEMSAVATIQTTGIHHWCVLTHATHVPSCHTQHMFLADGRNAHFKLTNIYACLVACTMMCVGVARMAVHLPRLQLTCTAIFSFGGILVSVQGCQKVAAPMHSALEANVSIPCRWKEVKALLQAKGTSMPSPDSGTTQCPPGFPHTVDGPENLPGQICWTTSDASNRGSCTSWCLKPEFESADPGGHLANCPDNVCSPPPSTSTTNGTSTPTSGTPTTALIATTDDTVQGGCLREP